MRYAQIRELDISNGEGVGVALFVQGCHFHCKGCFNQETWNFSGGKLFTDDTMKTLYDLIQRPYIKRISILGGEPLADENVRDVCEVIRMARNSPHKVKVWLYTGYTFEKVRGDHVDNLVLGNNPYASDRMQAIATADVVCDGRFVLDEQDINHKTVKWVGSKNQRVLDGFESYKQGRAVLYGGGESNAG